MNATSNPHPEPADQNKEAVTTDVISYAGQISMHGYVKICDVLKNKKGSKALLVLATPGGDPNAGFRIARALQHAYGQFELLVPRYCKSAGTLIAVGASHLYLADMSELGPLDIQVKKHDELIGRNSGLDIIAALDYLRDQSMRSFQKHCTELVVDAGLSTKAASDIAARLTLGLLEPIAGQIDPMKLAEMQRAMAIAYQYGQRLNEQSNNLRAGGLEMLVTGYPSHGFVIDRREAKTLFLRVSKPEGIFAQFSQALQDSMESHINQNVPTVSIKSYEVNTPGDHHEDTQPAIRPDHVLSQNGSPDPRFCEDAGPVETAPAGQDTRDGSGSNCEPAIQ